MPATTLGQLQSNLATAGVSNSGNYIEPGASFVGAVNEVGPRLYAMGFWKDLVAERAYHGGDGYLSVDRDVDAVLGAVVNDRPQRVFSPFHDMSQLGNSRFLPENYGLVDMNYHTAIRELPNIQGVSGFPEVTPITELHLFNSANLPVSNIAMAGGRIKVIARTAEGRVVTGSMTGTSELRITFPQGVMFFEEIVGEDLPFQIDLLATHTVQESLIAQVLRGHDVVRYRRYRVGGSTPNTFVHLLVKLAWMPVASVGDVVYLGNLSAWKHALLGKMAEDNADVERATYHWGVSRQMLEDEKDASRGSAIPKLNLDLTSGAGFAIHSQF